MLIINEVTRGAWAKRYEKRSGETENAIICSCTVWISRTDAPERYLLRFNKMTGISAIVSCGAPFRSGSILGSPELGWGMSERLFEQPGETAGVTEAVSGRGCANRCRPVSERRACRLQADSAQRRHRRHTAAAAKGELQRPHAAARASRRLGERDRHLRFSPEELLDPPHVAQSHVALRRRWRPSQWHPFLPATSPALH
jgi:hypothetical protein